MNKEMLKEKLNKLKEIIRSKEGITLVGIITILLVITLISVAVKDTHAYYNSVTDPVQIFNSKVGNFKPRIETFYIKDNNLQLKYTNQIENTVYITLGNNNKNLNQVCITETDDISTCDNKWQDIKSDNQYNYTFANTNEEGKKIIFGFVKDRYENKSESIRDTITYDVTPPTIEYSLPENTYTEDQTLTVTPKDTLSGIDTWSVHVYKGEPGDYSYKEEAKSADYTSSQSSHTITLEEGTWTIYTNIYDKAGNRHVTQRPERAGWYYQTYTIKKAGKSGQDLINERESNQALQDEPVDGMYRYYGTYEQVTNNYICLGPTAEETCQDGENMYRIIGITEDGKIKVIKAIPLKDDDGSVLEEAWQNSCRYDNPWSSSGRFWTLNNVFYPTINERIKLLIEYHTWNMELQHSDNWPSPNPTSSSISEDTVDAYVGLMYATDYPNAGPNGYYNLTNWLFITNGWNGNPKVTEWTMSRLGRLDSTCKGAWEVYEGYVSRASVLAFNASRPVFYLINTIKLTGSGISTDPFRIV